MVGKVGKAGGETAGHLGQEIGIGLVWEIHKAFRTIDRTGQDNRQDRTGQDRTGQDRMTEHQ